MSKTKHVAFWMLLIALFVMTFVQPFSKVSAQSILDWDGTEANGAIVLDESNKYLRTKSYDIQNDTGYVASGNESYVLSKNGSGTTFASLFVDTLGEGGEVLRGEDKVNGFDAYGYVAGSGELIYKTDEDGNRVQDESGQDVVVGNKSVAIKLKYNFSSTENIAGVDGNTWSVNYDSWQKGINGISPVGVVGNGAVIIQKFVPTEDKPYPTSNDDWKRLNEYSKNETDGIHTVNFFKEFSPKTHTDPFVLYTPSGEDLNKGVYIKVTIAYELYKRPFILKYFKNVVEETSFYLCNTSGEVVFENLCFSDNSAQETQTSQSSTTLEQKAGIITNMQGSVDGFRLDMRGSTFDIKYKFNGSSNYFSCQDGQTFVTPGRYDFKITTKLGLVRNKTIFVHERGEQNNAKIYFGESLFSSDSQKVFSPSDGYPVFAQGHITLKTNAVSNDVYAPLVGKVFKLDGDWEEVERDDKGIPKNTLVATKLASDQNWEFSDLEEGQYEAIFANNENFFDGETSGDTYKFVWRFSVTRDEQTPLVNQTTLENSNSISDFDSLHYVVAIQSAGEGKVLVCFSTFDDAYDFANRLLISKVQKTTDGFVFDKKTFSTEKALLENLHKVANDMVSKHYFDATDEMTYLTTDIDSIAPTLGENPSDEEIEEYNNFNTLANSKLPFDVIVFADEETSGLLTAGDAYLNDRPYAYYDQNGDIKTGTKSLKFISIGDFESQSITLFHIGTDLVFEMPYGVSVQEFLDINKAPSGRYRIVEQNYAGETEYYAIYLCPGDMLSSISLERTLNGITTNHIFNKLDDGVRLRANNVVFTGASNTLDPYGIIKIKCEGGETSIYHMSEYSSIPALDKEGSYEIILVDRIGRSIKFYVDIYSPNKVYSFKLVDGDEEILSARAYGGKTFSLPTLVSKSDKFVFGGWQDEGGNIFFDQYVFDSPKDMTLTAVWNYASVSVEVFDGEKIQSFVAHVGDLKSLPEVTKTGYDLFGFCFVQNDGTLRFYRGQINKIPNVEQMRLDAVWTKCEDEFEVPFSSDSKVMVSLVDGSIIKTFEVENDALLDLPQLRTDGLEFVGWAYQYGLTGSIFKSQINLAEVAQIGQDDKNAAKLVAVWKTQGSDDTGAILGTTSVSGTTHTTSTKLSTTAKTSIWSCVGILAILVAVVLACVFVKKRKKTKQPIFEQTIDEVPQVLDVKKQQKRPHHVNEYKFKTFDFKKVFARIVFPCLVVFMAFTMLFISQQGLFLSVRGYVDQKEYEETINTEITRLLDTNDDKDDIEQEKLHDTFARVQEAFGTSETQDTISETQSSSTTLNDEQAFLYTLISLDLMAMGYDVFPAIAYVKNDIIDGFGYSDYENIYESKDGKGILFGAGFVSLNSTDICQEDIDTGVIIEPLECDEESPKYVFSFSEEWGPVHYIAYGNYVEYSVQNYAINYKSTIDTGKYNDELGDVYNYDVGEITHYTNYGEELKFDSYSLSTDVDYTIIYEQLQEVLSLQDDNALTIEVENANFISYQALNDYMASNQNEALLGVDADILLQYEAQINDNYYYVIMADGSVQVLELPPDPEEKASLWERIWMGLTSIAGIALGVFVACIPYVGPFLSGAIIAASIDLFMQVTVSGTACDDIDWVSVGASAVTGILTAGIGAATSAATKAAVSGVKNAVAKFFIEAGIQLASGLFSGAISYLTTAGIKGEEITVEGILKALIVGGVTSVIMFCGSKVLKAISNKIKSFKNRDISQEQIERAVEKAKAGDCKDLNDLLNRKASKIAQQVRAENPNWTKMRQGSEIHKRMSYSLNTIKEFDLNSYGRADGIDDIAGIIFELKPHTQKSMLAGLKQLDRYEQGALRHQDLQKITNWIKILITYDTN